MMNKLQTTLMSLMLIASVPAHAAWFDFLTPEGFKTEEVKRETNGDFVEVDPPVAYYKPDPSDYVADYYTRDDLVARPIFNDGSTASYSMRPDGLFDAMAKRQQANLLRQQRKMTQIQSSIQDAISDKTEQLHDEGQIALQIGEPKKFRMLTDEEIDSGMFPEEWSESKKHKRTIELHNGDKQGQFNPFGTAPRPGDFNYDPSKAYNYKQDPMYQGHAIVPNGTDIAKYDNRKFTDPRAVAGKEATSRAIPDSWRNPVPESGQSVYLPNVHQDGQKQIQEKYHDTLAQNPEHRRAEPKPYVPTEIIERGNGLFDYDNRQPNRQPEQHGAGLSPEQGRVLLDQNHNKPVMPVTPNYVPNGIAQGAQNGAIQNPYTGNDNYRVVPGDSLSGISDKPRIYSDWKLWPLLWDANREQINDPDLIHPGQELGVPRNYTTPQELGARQRALDKQAPWDYYDGK